jgi:hypothetical protein
MRSDHNLEATVHWQVRVEPSWNAANLRLPDTRMRFLCLIVLLSATLVRAQEPAATAAAEAPNRDTSYIDENGAAHVTRVVPVPECIGPEVEDR